MKRIVAGVVAGYVAMFVAVFVLFTAAYAVLGTDGAFQPGSYEVSGAWIVVSVVVGIVSAVGGGWLCARIARSFQAVKALAAVVVVLGVLSAIPILMADKAAPALRSADVANLDAMANARQPLWIALLNPFLGAAGTLLGGRRAGTGAQPR